MNTQCLTCFPDDQIAVTENDGIMDVQDWRRMGIVAFDCLQARMGNGCRFWSVENNLKMRRPMIGHWNLKRNG